MRWRPGAFGWKAGIRLCWRVPLRGGGEWNWAVKNRQGDDSPDTSRAAMLARGRSWLERSGIAVPEKVRVEISPLWALDARDVEGRRQGFQPPAGNDWYLRD